MDLKPLINFLRVVSLIGLIVTSCMMVAVLYKKMSEYYPVQVEKYKWAFVLFAGLITFLMLLVYRKYIQSI